MNNFRVRYIILIVILSFFAAVIFLLQHSNPVEKNSVDISKLPLNIGQWSGEEIPVDKKTKDILETDSVLMRKYSNKDNEPVWLAIVYYKDSRVALHLPDSCYSGQGSHIVEKGIEEINTLGKESFSANKLILKGDKGNLVVLYYFETGNLRTHSYKDMRWQIMVNKLKSKSTSGALVRFSTTIKENPEKTLEVLEEFVREISGLLPGYLI